LKNYLIKIFNRVFRSYIELSALNIELDNLSIALCKQQRVNKLYLENADNLGIQVESIKNDYDSLNELVKLYRPYFVKAMKQKESTMIINKYGEKDENMINITDAKIEAWEMMRADNE